MSLTQASDLQSSSLYTGETYVLGGSVISVLTCAHTYVIFYGRLKLDGAGMSWGVYVRQGYNGSLCTAQPNSVFIANF
jgi:hypothetical protein